MYLRCWRKLQRLHAVLIFAVWIIIIVSFQTANALKPAFFALKLALQPNSTKNFPTTAFWSGATDTVMTSSQKVRNTNSIVMIDHDSPYWIYWYCSWHWLERFSSTLNEGLRCATDSGTAREPFTRLRITQYHLVLVNAFKPSREKEKPMQRPASAGVPPQFPFSYITTIGPPLSEIFLLPRRCLACPVQEPETIGNLCSRVQLEDDWSTFPHSPPAGAAASHNASCARKWCNSTVGLQDFPSGDWNRLKDLKEMAHLYIYL